MGKAVRIAVCAAALSGTALASTIELPPQTHQASAVKLDALAARLTVRVDPAATGITLAIKGEEEAVATVAVSTDDGVLKIEGKGSESESWSLFGWSGHDPDDLQISLTVGPGTPLTVKDYVGDAEIGDLNAALVVSAANGDIKAGRVTDARLSVAGSGSISVTEASGRLSASIAGSGEITAGSAAAAVAEIAGGGDISIGVLAGGLDIEIAGSGSVTADAVNGPVEIDIAGSGDVEIKSGRAAPLKVDIAGSGDIKIDGVAVDPDISVMGSGDVYLAAYEGSLTSDGGDVTVGKKQ